MPPLFPILTYCDPIWYFNRVPAQAEKSPYMDWRCLPDDIKAVIQADELYASKAGTLLDAAFQCLQRGCIPRESDPCLDIASLRRKLPLVDNYRFIKKYYGSARVYYTLATRLMGLCNPLKELKAFFNSRKTRRVSLTSPHVPLPDLENFSSPLLERNHLVSIIIPTLNRYEYLKDAIDDLISQSYKNIEIIVVDQSDKPDKTFYNQFPSSLKYFFQDGKGQWLSRNFAIKQSKGELILFFDDDSRVGADWVEQHIKALDYFKADISAGVSLSKKGDAIPANYAYFRLADQFDSGNAMVKREVFTITGLFDRKYDKMRMGDGEFGMRAYMAGFKSISNPLAKRVHLKVPTGGLRQMNSWDAYRAKWNQPRPIPSVLYYYKTYFSKPQIINGIIWGVIPSLVPYSLKHKKTLVPFSLVLVTLLLPLIVYQMFLSHKRSTILLNAPSEIESL